MALAFSFMQQHINTTRRGWGENESGKHTGFSRRTLAVIRSNTIVARSTVKAQPLGAIININLTVLSRPAVDTDAQVVALLVVTCGTVLTRVLSDTLVHVHRTIPTC